ncbi:hypothetical protein BC940DRAFT_308035 [Gongronella butleri]|nr:hypothetical protein BC940DRAFT_308035 [Gongronella butleri]
MTTEVIHDPLLFFPYGSSAYSVESTPSDSCSSTTSSLASPLSPTGTLATFTDKEIDWTKILSSIKRDMYKTTSATVPSPAHYMNESKHITLQPSTDPMFFYNAELLEWNDLYGYRQLRAENLMYRLLHCSLMKVAVDPTSLMRITKGVFVANKLEATNHVDTIMRHDVPDFMMDLDLLDTPAVDTFHVGNMAQFMQQSMKHQQLERKDFLPFSYTFGARFTNPYSARDVMIRGGRLPTWCQTLFLNECLQRMPLEPNVEYEGLFPFAPHVTVTFQTLASAAKANPTEDFYPDLLMSFERYAMELTDTDALYADSWPQQMNQIMEHILYCDIPQQAVPILTQLATMWAANQGFAF